MPAVPNHRVIPLLAVALALAVTSSSVAEKQADPPVVEGFISTSTFPLYHARIYPRRASEVWDEARALLKELRMKSASIDHEVGNLVTKAYQFAEAGNRRPPAPTLGDGSEGEVFELFVWVPQFIEPARVYVESVVFSKNRIYYQVGIPEEWFFGKLEERLGETGLHPGRRGGSRDHRNKNGGSLVRW